MTNTFYSNHDQLCPLIKGSCDHDLPHLVFTQTYLHPPPGVDGYDYVAMDTSRLAQLPKSKGTGPNHVWPCLFLALNCFVCLFVCFSFDSMQEKP